MDVHMRRGAHAIQGYYGVLNPEENWVTRLGVIPAAVKFRLHFPGKIAVGLSCPLAGNGMCFSREVIARFGWNAFSLTENWEYYIILTLHGYLVSVGAGGGDLRPGRTKPEARRAAADALDEGADGDAAPVLRRS